MKERQNKGFLAKVGEFLKTPEGKLFGTIAVVLLALGVVGSVDAVAA